ncbi:MAG: hypothetical protein GWO16_05860, partial [Gammaproteobacteria bacterium]|nr:hypothetical protein [Gammaproteobacteria bacterium]NIR97575.1 hypothetical protein [Gammaproteobacteria bacterium]NIT63219.1 hypothetical protein [Gammaproteobacteria bacterium]NIY31799.1 hypothetical protein [Gammaproteobacteria bacterium]
CPTRTLINGVWPEGAARPCPHPQPVPAMLVRLEQPLERTDPALLLRATPFIESEAPEVVR